MVPARRVERRTCRVGRGGSSAELHPTGGLYGIRTRGLHRDRVTGTPDSPNRPWSGPRELNPPESTWIDGAFAARPAPRDLPVVLGESRTHCLPSFRFPSGVPAHFADGVLAPPRTFASLSGAWGVTLLRLGRSGSGPSIYINFSWRPVEESNLACRLRRPVWCVRTTGHWHRVHESNAARRSWRPACSRSTRQTKRPQDLSPAASVWLLSFPVACYMLPPPMTKTAGRYLCGRPSVNVSIDSSAHHDRRGLPNGAIVCCDCLVNARVITSKTPLTLA